MEWVEGRLRRVLWASERSGYAVVRVETTAGAQITAVGPLAALQDFEAGAFVSLEGSWEDHADHGVQLRVEGFLTSDPRTIEGIEIYLGSAGIRGIGPAIAKRIVARFGLETPRILTESPQRLREVSGIGAKKVKALCAKWSEDERSRAVIMTLRGLGLPARHVNAILERYGSRAGDVVTRTPYELAETIRGVGFRTADRLARTQGLPRDDPARVRAAVLHVLDRERNSGHCYLPRRIVRRAVSELDVPVDALDDAIETAESEGRAVVEPAEDPEHDRVWEAWMFDAEARVASEIRRRVASAVGSPPVADEITTAEQFVGVTLDPTQRLAVAQAVTGGVCVITGGPGTGKTTLVRVLLRVLRERGEEWSLASPTGRAARRLEEATGQPALTIHRLLEYRPGEGGFQRNPTNPLELEGLVVDEASMVDLELLSALLDALPWPGVRVPLVLVGDADQLPSVGAGQVLRDLIASGAVPVVRLETIHRQAQESGIIRAAAEIHAGRVPVSGERAGFTDMFLLARDGSDRVRDTVLTVVSERLPGLGFDRDQIQVLTPTRKGPVGTRALNTMLQAHLNPDGAGLRKGEVEIREGDRVICTRNRYDLEVFNGDTGRVEQVHARGLRVRFDGRVVDWPRDDLGLLDLAYAITVHKSQGSEYPAVVVVLDRAHGIMLRRNLFYTAVTRARRFVCVVGSASGWARAVSTVGGDDRYTALAERLALPLAET
ncbi:MAG: exodeoxyribonuclease V alpha subunit [Myxococcota bacterium]